MEIIAILTIAVIIANILNFLYFKETFYVLCRYDTGDYLIDFQNVENENIIITSKEISKKNRLFKLESIARLEAKKINYYNGSPLVYVKKITRRELYF